MVKTEVEGKAMNNKRLPIILLLLTAAAALAGCKEEAAIVEEIRSIKTVSATALGTGRVIKFSGIVQATDSSALSFEVGGQVQAVNVDIGDRVEKGQVLAVLDKEPYHLEVKSAEAEQEKARANLTNKKADYEREEAIYREGAGSKKRFDQAKFGFEEAQAGVEFAVSKLNLARRDLRKTVLRAPYDGSIGKRLIEPHVDVRPGQKLLEIDAEGAREVLVQVPETSISLLTVGAPTKVSFTVLPGEPVPGRITYVGTAASTANAFPVKVALAAPPERIQPGMTAEVSFFLRDETGRSGYLIPPQAFLPGLEPNQGFLFVFDADSSTVKKTPVKVSGVKDNLAIVTEGLGSGDIIAVAGVGFLSDGQKVRLMEQPEQDRPATFELR